MFGDLFAEEGSFCEPTNSTGVNRYHGPPDPRPKHRLIGLKNLGTTCYLNSLIQTMYFTPGFRESLFTLTPLDLGAEASGGKGASKRKIPFELQRLFVRMAFLDQESVSTEDLTASFGWNNNQQVIQHDVQELNRVLFSAIERSLAGTPGRNLISSLYRGVSASIIQCLSCGRTNSREEEFYDLTVPIKGFPDLTNSLGSYTEMELLTGPNQYRCDDCGGLVDAYKGLRFKSLPPVLTISLNRFSYDWDRGVRVKENDAFSFPMELNMRPYCTDADPSDCPYGYEYDLYSVVNHSGAAHGGHYHAYICDSFSEGVWDKPSASNAKPHHVDIKDPLVLITTILKEQPSQSLSVTDLCAEIKTRTGVAWNGKYKKEHGPVRDFLLKRKDLFNVSPSELVILIKTESENDSAPPSCSSSSSSSSKNPNRNGTTNVDFTSSHIQQKETASMLFPPPQQWFDFNDSVVVPISKDDIKRKFSGKDSAYMIFYVSKSFRCQHANAPVVQPHMAEQEIEVADQNAQLLKERAAFDLEVNTIDIHVLPAQRYVYQNHSITPIEATPGNDELPNRLTLKIDKRLPVNALFELIRSFQPAIPFSEEFSLSNIKFLSPNRYHILGPVLPNAEVSVIDAGLCHGAEVIVWDGSHIGEVQVPQGEDAVPVCLSITLLEEESTGELEAADLPADPSQTEAVRQNSVADEEKGEEKGILTIVPKSFTIDQVKAHFLSLLDAKGSDFSAVSLYTLAEGTQSRKKKKASSETFKEIGSGGGSATVESLKLTRDTRIYAELIQEGQSKGNDVMTMRLKDESARLKRQIEIEVDVRPLQLVESILLFTVDAIDSVKDLKIRVFGKLSLSKDDLSQYRLRLIDADVSETKNVDALLRNSRVLVNETDKLRDAGVKGASKLIMEKGSLPSQNTELMLRFALGPKGAKSLHDILVKNQAEAIAERDLELMLALKMSLEDHHSPDVSKPPALQTQKSNPGADNAASESTVQEGEDAAFSRSSVKATSTHWECIVPAKTTVEELVKILSNIVGVDGDDWHICRTNWCGEVAAVVDDLYASLIEAEIKNDELILLERGRVTPKGYLRLFVWGNFAQCPEETVALLASLFPAIKLPISAPLEHANAFLRDDIVPLGEVLLHENNTLHEFKVRARDHLQLGEEFNLKCLRVRHVSKQLKMGAVLRSEASAKASPTLSRLKVANGSSLVLEFLPGPDELTHALVQLRVFERLPDGSFANPQLVNYPVASPSLAGLKEALSQTMGIQPGNLLIAKHNPARYQWLSYNQEPSTPHAKKKNKPTRAAAPTRGIDLRNAPYKLVDGDTLVVKDLSKPHGKDRADFMTEFDKAGQAREVADALAKKEERQHKKKNNIGSIEGGYRSRRPEVALTIDVPDFEITDA